MPVLQSRVAMEKYLSRNWFCCGLIGLFTLLLWGQTARFDFVWDDQIYITHNKSIHSLANIPNFFSRMEAQSAENPSIFLLPSIVKVLLYALLDADAPVAGQCVLARNGGDAPVPGRFIVMPAAHRRGFDCLKDGVAVDCAGVRGKSSHLGGRLLGEVHG